MSNEVDRPISPASCTSDGGDSTRREFFASARVQTSPTPTPLSETPKDFQLIPSTGPTAIKLTSKSDIGINPSSLLTTNGCSCGPECRQPCCVNGSTGWGAASSSRPKVRGSGVMVVGPRSVDRSVDKELESAVVDGRGTTTTTAVVHIHSHPGDPSSLSSPSSFSRFHDDHDRVSMGSNDSGGSEHFLGESRGETPLLPPDEQCCGGFASVTTTGRKDSPALDRSFRDPVRCGCHNKVVDKTAKKAKIRLILASVIALLFMLGEILGGYFSGSLAIMTDAAHMLSDFAGFLISLFAIWLGSRPSSNRMSFGWHRAEVMGAVVSVLIIWVVTGVLFYEAVQRVIHPIKINANIMLITACIGVFVNVFMCMVLHPHSHGHGQTNKRRRNRSSSDEASRGEEEGEEGEGEVSGRGHKRKFWQRLQRKRHAKTHSSEENINVRAAFIHVIGDLIQSIGVVIAGYIIWFKPEWTIADPICTFIFCIFVLISTLNVLKDALRVLMEGTPKHINYKELKEDLEDVRGVKKAHSLHIWSLTVNKTALAAHLVIEPSANHQAVLNEASQMLKERYNIISTTLQVEDHHDLMEECGTCQETDKAEFCNFTCWPF